MRRRSRLGRIDLRKIPGSRLANVTVAPTSDRAVRLLTCVGTAPTGQEVRLGTIMVRFDLTPTPVWSDGVRGWLTAEIADYILRQLAGQLRRIGGIW